MKPVKKTIVTVLSSLCLLTTLSSFAQKGWNGWGTINLSVPVTKKLDVRLGHMRAYEFSGGKNTFNQTQLRIEYSLLKNTKLYLGGLLNEIPSSTKGVRKRAFARITYKSRLFNTVNWTNGLHGEVNSIEETRFKYRVMIYSNLSLRNRLSGLHLLPSVTYNLFYNTGGNPVQYFDKSGAKTVKQSPDGFHRGRLYLNLNSKISDRISITAYTMFQREFNLLTDETHALNVVNPVTGKIARAFDNINVTGLTIDISLGKNGGKKNIF